MINLENWYEISKGLYRYVIGANVSYEIHIVYWVHGTNILTAKASLYLVGDWKTSNGNITERECLLSELPVSECLEAAVRDNKENNNY